MSERKSKIPVLNFPAKDYAMFSLASAGMTRFPPNVEQISVKHQGPVCLLTMRRNEIKIEMPLLQEDCQHLANLILDRPVKTKHHSDRHSAIRPRRTKSAR